MNTIELPCFSDYHAHFRQGGVVAGVAKESARYCSRVLAMPNLTPPIARAADALLYGGELRRAMPGVDVLLAVKLMPFTTPQTVRECAQASAGVASFKLYPAGATTHSADGIPAETLRSPESNTAFCDVLDSMQHENLVLCLHGEMPDQDHPFKREPDFIPFVEWVLATFPKLRVVMEHISTKAAVRFVSDQADRGKKIAATITVHHLDLHIGHLLGSAASAQESRFQCGDGKLHCHTFCWPCVKDPGDRDMLRWAACSGLPCFFLGSDSAPHTVLNKETSCGCAGVYTSPVLPEALIETFMEMGYIDKLADFVARYGDAFYGRPTLDRKLRFERQDWVVPHRVGGVNEFEPYLADCKLSWRQVA